ncbi:MAG: hypothetical protein HWE07_02680 [Cytophagia bacterium]|nr:hypothetical protein [Cytophagia bacterium]
MKSLLSYVMVLALISLFGCEEGTVEPEAPISVVKIASSLGELLSYKSSAFYGEGSEAFSFHYEVLGKYAGDYRDVYLEFGFVYNGGSVNVGDTFTTDDFDDYLVHVRYRFDGKDAPEWYKFPAEDLKFSLDRMEKVGDTYYATGSFELYYSLNVSIDFFGQFKNVKIVDSL